MRSRQAAGLDPRHAAGGGHRLPMWWSAERPATARPTSACAARTAMHRPARCWRSTRSMGPFWRKAPCSPSSCVVGFPSCRSPRPTRPVAESLGATLGTSRGASTALKHHFGVHACSRNQRPRARRRAGRARRPRRVHRKMDARPGTQAFPGGAGPNDLLAGADALLVVRVTGTTKRTQVASLRAGSRGPPRQHLFGLGGFPEIPP